MGLSKAELKTIVKETVQELISDGEFIDALVKKMGDKIESLDKNINVKMNLLEASIKETRDKEADKTKELEVILNVNKQKIANLENIMDKMQQNEKSRNVCIYGLSDDKEANLLESVLNIFNNSIRVEVQNSDIAACYRVGSDSSKSRPIIVKFENGNKRNLVLSRRRNLKGTNIGVTEDLTKKRLQLYKMAQDVFQRKSVFTRNGTILVRIGENKHTIFNEDDIRKLKP